MVTLNCSNCRETMSRSARSALECNKHVWYIEFTATTSPPEFLEYIRIPYLFKRISLLASALRQVVPRKCCGYTARNRRSVHPAWIGIGNASAPSPYATFSFGYEAIDCKVKILHRPEIYMLCMRVKILRRSLIKPSRLRRQARAGSSHVFRDLPGICES